MVGMRVDGININNMGDATIQSVIYYAVTYEETSASTNTTCAESSREAAKKAKAISAMTKALTHE